MDSRTGDWHAQPVNVQIVRFDAKTLAALAAGDIAAANESAPVPLSSYFACPEWASTWRRRAKQILDDPEANRLLGRTYRGPFVLPEKV